MHQFISSSMILASGLNMPFMLFNSQFILLWRLKVQKIFPFLNEKTYSKTELIDNKVVLTIAGSESVQICSFLPFFVPNYLVKC